MNHKCIISYGANVGHKLKSISSALDLISKDACCAIVKKSHHYTSPAWGYESDNEFINGVFTLETSYSAERVLTLLQNVEKQLGKTVKTEEGYQDRPIDLDLLFYDKLVLSSSRLILPHPYLQNRKFVLEPLVEIEPDWVHPQFLRSISELLERCSDNSVVSLLGDAL